MAEVEGRGWLLVLKHLPLDRRKRMKTRPSPRPCHYRADQKSSEVWMPDNLSGTVMGNIMHQCFRRWENKSAFSALKVLNEWTLKRLVWLVSVFGTDWHGDHVDTENNCCLFQCLHHWYLSFNVFNIYFQSFYFPQCESVCVCTGSVGRDGPYVLLVYFFCSFSTDDFDCVQCPWKATSVRHTCLFRYASTSTTQGRWHRRYPHVSTKYQ
jgi:hypothetical protein